MREIPMSTTLARTYIHLFGLDNKETDVWQRVINFSISQGKNYALTDQAKQAQVVVAAADTDTSSISAQIIRLSAEAAEGEVALKPPLLVTRVMRALEDAIKLVPDSAYESPQDQTEQTTTPPPMPAPPIPAIIEEKPKEDKETSQEQNFTALVIDDSFAIRKQLELELRALNITAVMAEDGQQALDIIAEQNDFDMIFLDIIMPEVDGYEVCKQIRKIPEMKKTPIIMLSGKDSPLDEVKGILAGASTYLTKPVKSDRLQETVQRVSKWLRNFS